MAMNRITRPPATAIAMMAPVDRPDLEGEGVGVLVTVLLEEPLPEESVPSLPWLLEVG